MREAFPNSYVKSEVQHHRNKETAGTVFVS